MTYSMNILKDNKDKYIDGNYKLKD